MTRHERLWNELKWQLWRESQGRFLEGKFVPNDQSRASGSLYDRMLMLETVVRQEDTPALGGGVGAVLAGHVGPSVGNEFRNGGAS